MMRAALAALACVAVAYALIFARPHATPGPPMRDFEAYYAAGETWNAGRDPYSSQIWIAERELDGARSSRFEALPFAGPPVLVPLLGAIARLPFAAANALWRALLAAAMLAVVLFSLRAAGLPLRVASTICGCIAALGFGPVTSAFALGQIVLPAFAFAAGALVFAPLAVLAWLQPNAGIVTVSLRRWIPAFVIFAAACVLLAGPQGTAHYADMLRAHGTAERFAIIQTTPAAIIYGFGAPANVAFFAGILCAAIALGVWVLRVRTIADPAMRFGATCALLPFAMPFFHEHDLLVTFFPAIVLTRRATGRLWGVAACGAAFCAVDWLGLAQRPDGVLQTALLTFAFTASLVAMREKPQLSTILFPVCASGAVAAAGIVAARHAVPVWPDAMGNLPLGIAAQPIAQAWHDELTATGLYAHDPYSAALRFLSLFGAGSLAYAALKTARATSRSPEAPHRGASSVRRPRRPLHPADY